MIRPLACLLIGGVAAAAPTLDQSYSAPVAGASELIHAGNSSAQTFTAGASGALSRIDVLLSRDAGDVGDLALEVWPVVAGGPAGATPLWSGSIDPASVPVGAAGYVSVDLTGSGLAVAPGESYAIAVKGSASLNGPAVSWAQGGPGYSDGAPFARPGSWFDSGSATDFGFKTWVDPTLLPAGLPTLNLTPTSEWQASMKASGDGVVSASRGSMKVERTPGVDTDFRALLEFDASAAPAGAQVAGAVFRFDVNQVTPAGPLQPVVDVYAYHPDGEPTGATASDLSLKLGGSGPIDSFDVVSVPIDRNRLGQMMRSGGSIGLLAYEAAAATGVSMVGSELAAEFPDVFPPPTLSIAYTTQAPIESIAGDYNGDAFVDAADYSVWRDEASAAETPATPRADGDRNGVIDSVDYDIWVANYGRGPDAGVANGGFESGDLTGWDLSVGPNTNLPAGTPTVDSFDVDGDGQADDALRLRVGRTDTTEFGGSVSIEQELLLAAGDYTITADVAARSFDIIESDTPGNFELAINGVVVDQVLMNGTTIGPLGTLRDSLAATLTDLQPGLHTISLTVANGATGSRDIFQYLDNLRITPIGAAVAAPEPSSAILAGVALLGVRRRRSRGTELVG